jgi:ABC-2 type transport system ATP-binding protein
VERRHPAVGAQRAGWDAHLAEALNSRGGPPTLAEGARLGGVRRTDDVRDHPADRRTRDGPVNGPLTQEVRRDFGYLPEERGLYPKMKIRDQLVFFGRLRGLSVDRAAERTDKLLERLGLAERATDVLETLSLGNQQRVQIAAALVHEPIALVLDEPFSGLDPLAVDAMVDLLREEVTQDVPVLFSSHQLELVERLCDDLVVLSRGKVVAAGPVAELAAGTSTTYRLVLDGDAGWLRDLPGIRVRDVAGGTALFDVEAADVEQRILQQAISRGPVLEFGPERVALSDVFREATR